MSTTNRADRRTRAERAVSLYQQAALTPGYERLALLVELADTFEELVADHLGGHDGCGCALCRYDGEQQDGTGRRDLVHLSYSAQIGVSFLRSFVCGSRLPELPERATDRLRLLADLLDGNEADASFVLEGRP